MHCVNYLGSKAHGNVYIVNDINGMQIAIANEKAGFHSSVSMKEQPVNIPFLHKETSINKLMVLFINIDMDPLVPSEKMSTLMDDLNTVKHFTEYHDLSVYVIKHCQHHGLIQVHQG